MLITATSSHDGSSGNKLINKNERESVFTAAELEESSDHRVINRTVLLKPASECREKKCTTVAIMPLCFVITV